MSITFDGPVPVPAKQTSALRVLVTGASRGIGFELVKQYAAAHADNIVIAAVRDPAGKSSAAVQSLAKQNKNIHILQLDVDNEQQVRDSATQVSKWTDTLDIVINNAAVSGENNDPLTMTGKQLNDVFNTNVTGVLVVTQTYLPFLRKSKLGGKAIQVSTPLGSNELGFFFKTPFATYGTSKAALNYLNTVFSHVVPDVVFVAVSPGWVSTDMGSAGGASPPTKVEDSVQALRYYIAEQTLKNTGDYIDAMSGKPIPF